MRISCLSRAASGALALTAIVFALCGGVRDAAAQTAPAPAPSASPSDTGPADPCTTTLAVVSRPSVTTSVCAVKPNHVLVESGYQNTIPDGGRPTAQYPQTLVRVGTAISGLEVSVAVPTYNAAAQTSGIGDTAYGIKYEMGYSSRWLYGVNAYVTVPSGSAAYSAGGTGYTGNINLNYTLTPGISLAGTVSANALSDGTRHYASVVPSLVIGGLLTGTTSLFGEVATFSHALGPGSATRVQYLGGIAQSFANRLQLDLEAARSSTAATGKYRYVGIGVSYAL